MKKCFILLGLASVLFFSSMETYAQIRKIPSEVTEALKEKYPNADHVSWKDRITVFVASFEFNHVKYEARFDEKGEWKRTEIEISDGELPGNVKDGFNKSKYADWDIKQSYRVELPRNVIQFKIRIAKSDIQKKNLLFNSDGKLLKDNIAL